MNKVNRHNSEYDEQTNDTFTISISDLMSGLLAIFILILSYFILDFSQAASQITQNDSKRAELLNTIHDRLKEEGIQVTIDNQHGILRISEGILFDVGMADIKDQGQIVIQKLGMVIFDTLTSEEFEQSVETIFIEGHTDSVPINNGIFPSNWELSTKRAINTWLTMNKANPNLLYLYNKRNQPIFSVSGYADTRPIADNNTDTGRKDNRRIDIRFSMTPPSEEDASLIKFVRKKMKNNG